MVRAFLSACIISILLAAAMSEIILFHLSAVTARNNRNFSAELAQRSGDALTTQALSKASELTRANANTIEEMLKSYATSAKLLSDYLTGLYQHKNEFSPISYTHPKFIPGEEAAMMWILSPGMVKNPTLTERDLTSAGVLEETYLLGNAGRLYESLMNNNPNILSIYMTTETGINSGRDYDAVLKRDITELELRNAYWYTGARDSGGLYISDTYRDAFDRGLNITMSIPFYGKSGAFAGVIGIDISTEDLDRSIQAMRIGDNGYALLLKDEKIISAPGLTVENENMMEFFLGNEYEAVIAGMVAKPSGVAKSVLTSTHSALPSGEVYIVWGKIDFADWQYALVVAVNDIVAPVANARVVITHMTEKLIAVIKQGMLLSAIMMAVILAVITGGVSVVAVYNAERIAKPIRTLTEGARIIGGGNLEHTFDIHTGDELETLAGTFNTMVGDIRRITGEKERIGAELSVATKIQASMLPCIFPPFPDKREFDLYASMLPAKEVGGDFYDFFLLDENTLAMVIADVSGKGVPAALFMVIAKTLIKNSAQSGKSPKEVFETVNNMLCENNEACMFVTAFMAYLDIQSGRFTFVNAGHNPPLIRSNRGDFKLLKMKPGFILGAMAEIVYVQDEIVLSPDDEMYLYTDGVTEAGNKANELFTEKRLLNTANENKGAPLPDFIAAIKTDIDLFADGAEQSDDITMFALRYKGPSRDSVLRIEARIENLDTVLDFVNAAFKSHDCPQKILSQIALAIEEIFVNIAYYAYAPEVGEAEIRVTSDDVLTIIFEDGGVPFNPLEKPEPDLTLPAEEREIGGLGIFMMKNVMDGVEYRREGDKNILTINKVLRPRDTVS
jgi:sigma-B regulation protein RsbU (phosphoserine phosphatase)